VLDRAGKIEVLVNNTGPGFRAIEETSVGDARALSGASLWKAGSHGLHGAPAGRTGPAAGGTGYPR
jgi:hypothetical protein